MLVCSGGLVPDLSNRLGAFLAVPENVAAVLEDPYALWVPVLTDLWRFMDNKVESLNDKFKREEEFMIVSSPPAAYDHQC